MTATTRATRPSHGGCARRRLHALEVLTVRMILLAAAMFVLLTTRIAETLGVLLALVAIVAASTNAVRSFRRAWTEPSRKPRRVRPVVLDVQPLRPIAVDRDANTRYRSTPRGDGGRA